MGLPIALTLGLSILVSVTGVYVMFRSKVLEGMGLLPPSEHDAALRQRESVAEDESLPFPMTGVTASILRRTELLLMEFSLLGVGAALVFVIDLAVVYALAGKYADPTGGFYAFSSGFTHAVLAIPPIAAYLKDRSRTRFDIIPRGVDPAATIGVVAIATGMLTNAAYRTFVLGRTVTIAKELNIASIFVIVVIAPLTEELFFRGYLQGRIFRKLGDLTGILCTSLAFVVIHIPKALYYRNYLPNPFSFITLSSTSVYSQIIFLSLMFAYSLVFCYLYEQSKSLLHPTLAHFLINLSGILR